MMRFIRVLGGALGAILAISLAAASTSFFDPSVAGFSAFRTIRVCPAERTGPKRKPRDYRHRGDET